MCNCVECDNIDSTVAENELLNDDDHDVDESDSDEEMSC
jgi:hypothetical protein